MKSYLRKIKLLISRMITSSPNRIIVTVGLLISLTLFFVATLINGIWSDFLVNLSAGVLTVVFTVILVDMLRTSHRKKQYAIPQKVAVNLLKGSHSGFLLGLISKVYKGDPELTLFAKDFMNAGEEANKGNVDALAETLTKYVKKLCALDVSQILRNYTRDELRSNLKVSIEKLRDDIEKINRRYDFSFIEVNLNTDFAELINHIDGTVGMFVVLDLDSQTLSKLLKPPVAQDQAAQILIGTMLKVYLNNYNSFLEKYGSPHVK